MALQDGPTGWSYRMVLQDGPTGWSYRMVLQDGLAGWFCGIIRRQTSDGNTTM